MEGVLGLVAATVAVATVLTALLLRGPFATAGRLDDEADALLARMTHGGNWKAAYPPPSGYQERRLAPKQPPSRGGSIRRRTENPEGDEWESP
jgi:hypothetical protein